MSTVNLNVFLVFLVMIQMQSHSFLFFLCFVEGGDDLHRVFS